MKVSGLVLVGVVAGLFLTPFVVRLIGPADSSAVPDEVLAPADAVAEGSPASGPLAANEELQSGYEERKLELPPEVVEPLARDLSVIETAISEIGAALVNDPDNDSLKQMLVATYRNQIKVLKHALRIAGDDPEDYVAE